jgi:hypothetical protein
MVKTNNVTIAETTIVLVFVHAIGSGASYGRLSYGCKPIAVMP